MYYKIPPESELNTAYWWDVKHEPFLTTWESPFVLANGTQVQLSYENDRKWQFTQHKRIEQLNKKIKTIRSKDKYSGSQATERLLNELNRRKKQAIYNALGDPNAKKEIYLVFKFPLHLKVRTDGMQKSLSKGIKYFEKKVGSIDWDEIINIEKTTANKVRRIRHEVESCLKRKSYEEKKSIIESDYYMRQEQAAMFKSWGIVKKALARISEVKYKSVAQIRKDYDKRGRKQDVDIIKRDKKIKSLHWRFSEIYKKRGATDYYKKAQNIVLEKVGISLSDSAYRGIVYPE